MEIETALASGGGDDEAIEDMIVNSSWKKDGGHTFDPEIGGFLVSSTGNYTLYTSCTTH